MTRRPRECKHPGPVPESHAQEKAPVTVHMLDGKEIHGHIKSFDNFASVRDPFSGETVYKHGASSITHPRYLTTQRESFVEG
jgi:RNA chaperone Hfq